MLLERIFDNCALHGLSVRGDERGRLIAIEGRRDVEFDIARVYYIFGTQPDVARGFHAHRNLVQWLVCVSGSCRIVLDDGLTRREVILDRPDTALEIGTMIWREMYDFSADAVLMVLASQHYDEGDYIRDHDAFLGAVGGES